MCLCIHSSRQWRPEYNEKLLSLDQPPPGVWGDQTSTGVFLEVAWRPKRRQDEFQGGIYFCFPGLTAPVESPRSEGSLQYKQCIRECRTDNINSNVEEQASHASTATSLHIYIVFAPALADSATALQELLRSAKATRSSTALFPKFPAHCVSDGCTLWHVECVFTSLQKWWELKAEGCVTKDLLSLMSCVIKHLESHVHYVISNRIWYAVRKHNRKLLPWRNRHMDDTPFPLSLGVLQSQIPVLHPREYHSSSLRGYSPSWLFFMNMLSHFTKFPAFLQTSFHSSILFRGISFGYVVLTWNFLWK